ncbi:MAG: hypothetical protein Tsb002_18970 [Wenzhouxiangellaceae bacterium]
MPELAKTNRRILAALLLLTALGALSLWRAPSLPASPTVLTIPGEEVDIESAIMRDRDLLDHTTLAAISKQMEAAWSAELPAACEDHQATATRLANQYPTLLSAWSVLWQCLDADLPRYAGMESWIYRLMQQPLQTHDLEAAAYPEFGLPVHNLTDAMNRSFLYDLTMLDAWYEMSQEGQLLRIGLRLWDPEASRELTRYYNPVSTINAYQQLYSDDEYCRLHLAECIIKYAPLSDYTSLRELPLARAEYAYGQRKDAIQRICPQRAISYRSALQCAEWLIANNLFSDRDEVISESIDLAIENYSAQAYVLYAVAADTGVVTAEDPALIEERWQLAVDELGEDQALYWRGRYLELIGSGWSLVTKAYEEAAAAGSSAAMQRLYRLLKSGSETDQQQALEWLLRAAHDGDRQAMVDLAWRFDEGDGIEQSEAKAIYWWRKAAALGHSESLSTLSHQLDRHSDPALAAQAIAFARQAAELHDVWGMNNAAFYARDGELDATPEQILLWFQMAAERGADNAQRALGQRYQRGDGVPRDLAKARYWLEQAAAQDNADALNQLGDNFHDGVGVAVDYRQALLHYHRAAQQGHSHSQWMLGYMFEHAEGVSANPDIARQWYQLAAEQNHSHALRRLGWLHESGQLGDIDMATAIDFYTRSGEAGNAGGWVNLAWLYDTGDGVTADAESALDYYRRGEEDGERASNGIQRIEETGLTAIATLQADIQQLTAEFQADPTAARAMAIAERIESLAYLPEMGPQYDHWMQQAADLGSSEAAYQLGADNELDGNLTDASCPHYLRSWELGNAEAAPYAHYCGSGDAEAIDPERLIAMWRYAQQQGSSTADLRLAGALWDHYPGDSAKRAEAVRLYRDLADDHPFAAMRVAFHLEHQVEDAPLADILRYYRPAAEAGYSSAQNNMGRLMMSRGATAAQREDGWDWVYLAHLQQNPAATDTLGEAHQYGWLGDKDWPAAVDFYQQAGELGQAMSYFNAAALYFIGGHGLDADAVKAKELLAKADQAGLILTGQRLDDLSALPNSAAEQQQPEPVNDSGAAGAEQPQPL